MAMTPPRRERPGISAVLSLGTKSDLHERLTKNSTTNEWNFSHYRGMARRIQYAIGLVMIFKRGRNTVKFIHWPTSFWPE
jgi:TATA-box binding protein (TBP) (component of TFIID and TFIIIB)